MMPLACMPFAISSSSLVKRALVFSLVVMSHLNQKTLPLTHWTQKRRPPVLHDPLNLATASRRNARFALAVIDAEMVLEIAKLAIGLAVIAQRRSAGLDGVVEHRLDGVDQRRRLGVRGAGACRNGGGAPLRRQPRPVQGLARID